MADNNNNKDTKDNQEEKVQPKQKDAPKTVKWKNPTKQKIEVSLAGKAISFLPAEVVTFNDPTIMFGKNTRLIKI